MDSIPMVAITGQVSTALMGRDAFQETDVLGMVAPITKHAFLVERVEDIQPMIARAFTIAMAGRPGPGPGAFRSWPAAWGRCAGASGRVRGARPRGWRLRIRRRWR